MSHYKPVAQLPCVNFIESSYLRLCQISVNDEIPGRIKTVVPSVFRKGQANRFDLQLLFKKVWGKWEILFNQMSWIKCNLFTYTNFLPRNSDKFILKLQDFLPPFTAICSILSHNIEPLFTAQTHPVYWRRRWRAWAWSGCCWWQRWRAEGSLASGSQSCPQIKPINTRN